MKPEDFKQLRIDLRLSNRGMGTILGLHYRTIQRYCSGETRVPEWAVVKLDEMLKKLRSEK